MLYWDLQIIVGSEPLRDLIRITWIKKNSVVTGIEPTTSRLLDQRCSGSDNQAPQRDLYRLELRCWSDIPVKKTNKTLNRKQFNRN